MKTVREILSEATWSLRMFFYILGSAAHRFYWDDCFSRAAALSYTTLFALVPITALSFSMFGVFGLDNEQLSITLKTVLEQVLPPMKNAQLEGLQTQVFEHLQRFSLNVKALNTVSVAVLVFTCIALLNTVESALNVIWRVSGGFSLSKWMSFWAVLTLGPLFVALSIFWTTKVRLAGFPAEWSLFYYFVVSYVAPVVVTAIGLVLLFYKLPAARVRLGDAVLGGVIAAVLFEFTKRGFASYIGASTTYSTMYGVLTSIPLFLFWLYVGWVVVLYGAEVSYQSGSIDILRGLRRYATDLGEIGGVLGLRLLSAMGRRFLSGESPCTESELAIDTGADPVLVRACLNVLYEAALISVQDERTHTRTLLVSPEQITVGRVLETFRSKEHRRKLKEQGPEKSVFLEAIRRTAIVVRDERQLEEWTLSDLIRQTS